METGKTNRFRRHLYVLILLSLWQAVVSSYYGVLAAHRENENDDIYGKGLRDRKVLRPAKFRLWNRLRWLDGDVIHLVNAKLGLSHSSLRGLLRQTSIEEWESMSLPFKGFWLRPIGASSEWYMSWKEEDLCMATNYLRDLVTYSSVPPAFRFRAAYRTAVSTAPS